MYLARGPQVYQFCNCLVLPLKNKVLLLLFHLAHNDQPLEKTLQLYEETLLIYLLTSIPIPKATVTNSRSKC